MKDRLHKSVYTACCTAHICVLHCIELSFALYVGIHTQKAFNRYLVPGLLECIVHKSVYTAVALHTHCVLHCAHLCVALHTFVCCTAHNYALHCTVVYNCFVAIIGAVVALYCRSCCNTVVVATTNHTTYHWRRD
jgi:hypothetical protein